MAQDFGNQGLVRCWNCSHLTTLYLGGPKNGRLFEKTVQHCRVKGLSFEKRYDIIALRRCGEHTKAGLSETPPEHLRKDKISLFEADQLGAQA